MTIDSKWRAPARASYLTLFVFLLGTILVQPLFTRTVGGRALLSATFSLLLVLGLWAVGRTAWWRGIGLAIALPALVFRWVAFVRPDGAIEIAAAVLSALFCLYVAVVFVSDVLREPEVGTEQIFGASCAYILIGLMWAFCYAAADMLQPGAFNGHDAASSGFSDFIYFSFITLTTLGYGDMTPASPMARMLAVLEGIIGQLYIAILIARLVGAHSPPQRSR